MLQYQPSTPSLSIFPSHPRPIPFVNNYYELCYNPTNLTDCNSPQNVKQNFIEPITRSQEQQTKLKRSNKDIKDPVVIPKRSKRESILKNSNSNTIAYLQTISHLAHTPSKSPNTKSMYVKKIIPQDRTENQKNNQFPELPQELSPIWTNRFKIQNTCHAICKEYLFRRKNYAFMFQTYSDMLTSHKQINLSNHPEVTIVLQYNFQFFLKFLDEISGDLNRCSPYLHNQYQLFNLTLTAVRYLYLASHMQIEEMNPKRLQACRCVIAKSFEVDNMELWHAINTTLSLTEMEIIFSIWEETQWRKHPSQRILEPNFEFTDFPAEEPLLNHPLVMKQINFDSSNLEVRTMNRYKTTLHIMLKNQLFNIFIWLFSKRSGLFEHCLLDSKKQQQMLHLIQCTWSKSKQKLLALKFVEIAGSKALQETLYNNFDNCWTVFAATQLEISLKRNEDAYLCSELQTTKDETLDFNQKLCEYSDIIRNNKDSKKSLEYHSGVNKLISGFNCDLQKLKSVLTSKYCHILYPLVSSYDLLCCV